MFPLLGLDHRLDARQSSGEPSSPLTCAGLAWLWFDSTETLQLSPASTLE